MKKLSKFSDELHALAVEVWHNKGHARMQIRRFENELSDKLDFIEVDKRANLAEKYKDCVKKYLLERIMLNRFKLKPRENAEMIILAEKRIMAAYMEKEHLLNDFAGLTMLSDNEKFN